MIKFAFYIHNHQPVGNFDEVFEYAYGHSYLPFLKTLMKHKTIKCGIHNSGTLLDWIFKRHPEYFELLRDLVKKGQIEILTSAYAEPILSLIPKKDAIDQIKYFNDFLYKNFNYQPKGLWLTERIWEPGLISILIDTGIEYTLLDDTHFLYAGLEHKDLYSYFTTEDEGRKLKIFPISMRLRYLIPFRPIEETIKYLKEEETKKDDCVKTLGDDGEKFGVWPGTYNWVHKEGWFEEFLTRMENETWIETCFLHNIADEAPAGRIYLPTSSYEEMGKWVLPPKLGREYEELKRNVDGKYYRLIQGGYFKNFLRKYPEANIMHKRMLHVSKNIDNNLDAKLSLWRGQCSCAYWHGIFGGIYLPHLRESIYENLIEAENFKTNKLLKFDDFDVDGEEEIIYSDEEFFVVLKPKSASFIEFDDRRRKMNILNYLGRREEKYHQNLPQETTNADVRSIHEIYRSKEKNLTDYLIYDRYERRFGLDRMLDKKPGVEGFRLGSDIGRIICYEEFKILNDKKLSIEFSKPIRKIIEFTGKNSREVCLKYQEVTSLFGIEFSLGIFHSNLRLDNQTSLLEPLEIEDLNHFCIRADNFKPIKFKADHNFDLLSYPIETVSSSEAGFEKNFQGIALMLIFAKSPKVSIEL
jgi:alpha-amylase/alpha-mannosidase (GH57 family)